jgi:hypothetical protein
MEVTERRLEDLSRLAYAFQTCPFPRRRDRQALIVSFEGYVRPHQEDEATFMDAITKAALTAWESQGLILDLRGLRYEPGSDIGAVMWAPENLEEYTEPCPTRMIFSASNHDWLLDMVQDMEGDPSEWLAGTLEEALDAVEKEFEKEYEKQLARRANRNPWLGAS